ncbi:MAG TPA: type II secretion system protein [Methylomirabilota bacterium]|nr:type II secretion system protein [Methylomirabilota bacterium]
MKICDQRGFTLPEVLLTVVVITIGLAAVLAAVPLGAFGVQDSRQLSTATFLADQKLEQARSVPWRGMPANDCLGLSAPPTAAPTVPAAATCAYGAVAVGTGGTLPWFADEGPAAIPGFPGYSRQVRITDCAAGCAGAADTALRLVAVTVTYTPLALTTPAGGAAPAPKSVAVNMLISQR